ncbi:hypothetical protein WG70_13830 [Burkholderia oklahomensis EO147]|nr:hypothetical protein WG70_13830 [Burkholderia oklahomensis EO147]KUY55445.1 hypothetical protein WG70_11435 [Burkholderia oklahomensis EO147]
MRAVYTMPTPHDPLGSVMSAPNRARLAELAERHDLLVIEDAACAAYRARLDCARISRKRVAEGSKSGDRVTFARGTARGNGARSRSRRVSAETALMHGRSPRDRPRITPACRAD